jgi:hypothetical protein
MSWFVAKTVFQIICGDGNHNPQFDEQLRLINAANEFDAFQKALTIAAGAEETFYNDKQQLVQWKFIDVAELTYLGNRIEDAELCSMIKEAEDASLYINFVHNKAKTIREKFASGMLKK